MRVKALVSKAVLVALVVAATGIFAQAAQTTGSRGRVGSPRAACAKLKVRAHPMVNAQSSPNTHIKSTVTSCSSRTERVTLEQTISGPTDARAATVKTWEIKLAPGKTAVKKRSFPYMCCGTFTVTDRVLSKSGKQLAKATTSFIDA